MLVLFVNCRLESFLPIRSVGNPLGKYVLDGIAAGDFCPFYLGTAAQLLCKVLLVLVQKISEAPLVVTALKMLGIRELIEHLLRVGRAEHLRQ